MASRECGRTAASFARPILRDACFGPLLPVAVKPDPLHFGVVLAIAMGIGPFAPPLGLGLYGTCLIGNVPIEQTVKPILGYLGVLLPCLLVVAFVPEISTALPPAFGYQRMIRKSVKRFSEKIMRKQRDQRTS